MIVFGLTIASMGGGFIGLSSFFVFITQVKRSSLTTCLYPLGLDDGVPVKVVLDVVCSQHASHLEVSQRKSVLLLAQLAEVAWTQKQRRQAESLRSFR